MKLKRYIVNYGIWIIAESKTEAIRMFAEKFHKVPERIKEENVNDSFCYFDLDEIDEEDYKYIYDRRCIKGVKRVSLKHPYAGKYKPLEKSIGFLYH